jgi:biopolymer transport protein ExbD
MAASSSGDDDIISAINVTPMVDIMLVLLIIFMLTANIIAAPSIHVELPKAATGSETEPSLIGVSVVQDGSIFLNEKPVTERELYDQAMTAVVKKPETEALIAADKGVPYGRVVRVIDLIKRAGIAKFALNIEVEQAGP